MGAWVVAILPSKKADSPISRDREGSTLCDTIGELTIGKLCAESATATIHTQGWAFDNHENFLYIRGPTMVSFVP